MTTPADFSSHCPLPADSDELIGMGHGSGGQQMQRLLEQSIYPQFDNAQLAVAHDSALLDMGTGTLAFSTDSFIVKPLFFPGGDIGQLAVYGTVNDLLMAGAMPRYLSCSFILEEGLPVKTLERVVASMAAAARASGVNIVTGDTKVVERGHGDGLFINTAGIGTRSTCLTVAPQSIREGDVIIVSGDIGRHGTAIMSCREGLEFDSPLLSDCASLLEPVSALLSQQIEIHCLRDLTRGGLATALIELTESAGKSMMISERDIEINPAVQGCCELLGLDPLYVANEGRFVCLVPEADAEQVLEILRACPVSAGSRVIGLVGGAGKALTLTTHVGTRRTLRRQNAEQLPRIC